MSQLRRFMRAGAERLSVRLADLAQRLRPLPQRPYAAHLPAPPRTPPVGAVDFGDLRRVVPISSTWGFDRGRPVDRYYIEQFLERHAQDVRGRVLEIGDASYTRRFGGDRVTKSDVLNATATSDTTIVADLNGAAEVPSDAFDCIILTQTLQFFYDVQAVMRTLGRMLKPGGVLLLTVPGISQTTDFEWRASWYWFFTSVSLQRLGADTFTADACSIESYGNVLACVAFLEGIANEELAHAELAVSDPDFPVILALRAVKPPA